VNVLGYYLSVLNASLVDFTCKQDRNPQDVPRDHKPGAEERNCHFDLLKFL